MNKMRLFKLLTGAFLVLGVLDILERQRAARERNKTLADIRETVNQEHYDNQSFRERFAAHFPYKREVKGEFDHPFTPAHSEPYIGHIADIEEPEEDDE